MNTHQAGGAGAFLGHDELAILEKEITRGRIKTDVHQYSDLFESRHVSHPDNPGAVLRALFDLYTIGKGRLWLRPHRFRLFKGQKKHVRANVEAMLPGVNSSQVVIVAAHLDCTASRDPAYRPEKDPAPGADDDASGIAGVLGAARAIVALAAAEDPARPRAEIRFALFNAEEQAQRGSRVYARREKKRGTQVSAMYQMDMIGYRKPVEGESDEELDTFELHAGFKKDPEVQAASLEVAHHLIEVCAAAEFPLHPQVYFHRPRKRDPGQGFSDHTSFHRHGFPAVLVSENFFPGPPPTAMVPKGYPNPDYHLPEDTLRNLDPGYAADIARAVAAAAWHRATRIACGAEPRGARNEQHQCGENSHGSRDAVGGRSNKGRGADGRVPAPHHTAPGHPAGHG